MQLTETQYHIAIEQGKTFPFGHESVFVAEEPFAGWPPYKGQLRAISENPDELMQIIKISIENYGYLIPRNTLFKLCYLGEKIKKAHSDDRSILIASVLLVNGDSFGVMQRKPDGNFRTI